MTQRPSIVIRSSEQRAQRGKPRKSHRGEMDDLHAKNVAQDNYLQRVRPLTDKVNDILAVQTSNTASFSATKGGSNQAIATTAATKITFDTELFDIGGFYNSSTWTPPAGNVLIIVHAYPISITNGSVVQLMIYKNGAIYKLANHSSYASADAPGLTISLIDVADGDDTYEAYILSSDSSYSVDGTASITSFMGTMV